MTRWIVGPVAAAIMLVACSSPAAPPAPPRADVRTPSSQAPRITCAEPEATHSGPAARMADRELVPLAKSTFGVESTYGTNERGFMLVSGGYLDDVLEAYDELRKVRETTVRGATADVLVGTFVTPEDTRAAIWRESQDPPCDAHAVVAWNLTAKQFGRVLAGLR